MASDPFQGEMIALRPFEPDDAPELKAYLDHPDLIGCRYIPWAYPDMTPLSQGQIAGIIQKWAEAEKSLPLAVVRLDTGELVGHAECDWGWDPHQPSVHVVIAPAQQRQGYGSEALGLLLHYLFDYTPAHCVTCWIAGWNQPGLEFIKHCGFQVSGRMRRAGVREGEYLDVVITDLLRPEWQELGGGHHAA